MTPDARGETGSNGQDHDGAHREWRAEAGRGGAQNGVQHRVGADEVIVLELAKGRPHPEVAATAGVSLRTVERRAGNPEIRRAVVERRAQTVARAAAKWEQAVDAGIEFAAGLMLDEEQPATVRLRAFALVAGHYASVVGVDHTVGRIADLEEAVQRQQDHTALTTWSP